MLRRYTTSSFSGHSTSPRPRCYTSEGKAFAPPGQKHIYPLHHHSRTQTRGRSNIASLVTFFDSFFATPSSLLDKHVLRALFIWVYGLPPGMVCTSSEGNKLDARHGILTRTSPLLVSKMSLSRKPMPVVPVRVLEVECHLPTLGL
jgi:hypothetical protein